MHLQSCTAAGYQKLERYWTIAATSSVTTTLDSDIAYADCMFNQYTPEHPTYLEGLNALVLISKSSHSPGPCIHLYSAAPEGLPQGTQWLSDLLAHHVHPLQPLDHSDYCRGTAAALATSSRCRPLLPMLDSQDVAVEAVIAQIADNVVAYCYVTLLVAVSAAQLNACAILQPQGAAVVCRIL
eukprot:11496-Heterococcus_DN1.PRE.1